MMTRRSNKTASAALLILSALSGCSFFDSAMLTACEASLKKRLLSPSKYERIGDDSQASEVTVSIDGKTYTEWLIEGIRAAAEEG